MLRTVLLARREANGNEHILAPTGMPTAELPATMIGRLPPVPDAASLAPPDPYARIEELKQALMFWAQLYSEQKERVRNLEAEVARFRILLAGRDHRGGNLSTKPGQAQPSSMGAISRAGR